MITQIKHAAIPTLYSGVQFRSRLEARWAVMFDLIGWKWIYEPFDANGYIPDFKILNDGGFIVEVKPIDSIPSDKDDPGWDEWLDPFQKAKKAGVVGGLIVVGSLIFKCSDILPGRDDTGECVFGLCTADYDRFYTFCFPDFFARLEEWKFAGNEVQWRAK